MKEAYGNINLEMLKEFSEVHGIAGNEKYVSRVMRKWMTPYCDEIEYDHLGSIVGIKKGAEEGPRVMLSAHMDEVGFLVREIDDQGYIKLLPVGGWWGHVMPAQEFVVTTRDGSEFLGVIGTSAPHGMPKEIKEKVIKPVDMFLDMGVDSKQEIIDLGIQINDMVTPSTKFKVMNNPNYLVGKAWDDRICGAVIVDVLRLLEKDTTEASVYAAGTVQEEVGIRGARTMTQKIKPDVAIALDVTTSMDTPVDQGQNGLGKGVVLSIMDASVIANKNLMRMMETICKDLDLDINYDLMAAGGTDAGNIHKSMDGVITMTLSLPTRYMHSPKLLIHRKDYWDTVCVIAEFCRRIDMVTIEEWKSNGIS